MTAQSLSAPRFVRKTQLGPGEYRKNFHQIDRDVSAAVSSPEADRITPLMSKIYLRLVNAPARYWEREGVLRFEADTRGEKLVGAWDVLCELVGVASATARKALRWMHEQGIIGYCSGKNGVGIRIFLNRAASSIGTRGAGQKILAFPRASLGAAPASTDEAAFMDSYAVREVLDPSLNPRAPKNGAGHQPAFKNQPDPRTAHSLHSASTTSTEQCPTPQSTVRVEFSVEDVVSRLRRELEPSIQSAARQAAAQEHERTREWLESRGLPKAARVAQREAFNLLRRYGVIKERAHSTSLGTAPGRSEYNRDGRRPLSGTEIDELAQACVAMRVMQERSIEQTLSEMSSEAGGFLLPGDAVRVREKAEAMLAASRKRRGG